MNDLISRRAAIQAIDDLPNCYNGYSDAYDKAYIIGVLEEVPSVEPKKGKWLETDAYPHNVYCSECFKNFAQTHWVVWEDGSLPRKFCPNCGARMESE